jgi:hypothetical protein
LYFNVIEYFSPACCAAITAVNFLRLSPGDADLQELSQSTAAAGTKVAWRGHWYRQWNRKAEVKPAGRQQSLRPKRLGNIGLPKPRPGGVLRAVAVTWPPWDGFHVSKGLARQNLNAARPFLFRVARCIRPACRTNPAGPNIFVLYENESRLKVEGYQ